MSEEEFFNRLLNKIAKELGYDTASTLELMFMTREKKVEQLENIRKEAIEYIDKHTIMNFKKVGLSKDIVARIVVTDLLNILNKGE